MSTPLWRQVLEGTYDPFSSSFDRRSSSSGSFEGLSTDWRAFQIEEDAQRNAERELEQQEREALELRGDEYVNLSQAQGRLESAVGTAEALGQPGIQPTGPPSALEGIANVLDSAKSAVVGGLSGLMGWDIEGDDVDPARVGVSRFTRQEDIVGDRNRLAVAWERALKGLLGGQSYGFGDFEALRYEQDDPRLERVLKGVASFTLDVALDPLTYFSFGSSVLGRVTASTGVRQISRSLGQETLQRAGDAAVRNQVERLGVRELATRVSSASGKEFDSLLVRTPQQLADDLLAASRDDFVEAAVDSWSFGNAAAYGARGRTGLYDRLVETVGRDIADETWQKIPLDVRGGARVRVPFRRTTDETTGLRLPTVLAFPGSNPGRGFDTLGLGTVVRKMNQARLIARTGPFKFLEHVSGGTGRSWTNVLQAARNGDGEAIEAYAIHFGTMAFNDAYRLQSAAYDQMASAGMQAIGRQMSAAAEQNLDQNEILDFARDLYFKRGREDLPVPSAPEHVVAVDIAKRLFEMTDNTHKLATEIYGEDAARKMEDYATRMLTPEGFEELQARYGRLEGRRGSLVEGDSRRVTSYPKTMALDENGNLVVTSWMTPDEITDRTGQTLFISDPVEAVGEYLIMMRRELMRDWSLKKLDELGLLKSIGEDVIRQPKIEKIQSEAHSRMLEIRDAFDRLERGEDIPELEPLRLAAEQRGAEVVRTAGNLSEVEPGVWRSADGLVEIRKNRSGGYSASVANEPVFRPTVSQLQAEELVPEIEAYAREVDWDEVRSGFYDADGNRIPARQVRMEGVDDPRWITTEPAPAPAAPGRAPRAAAPEPDDSREISGTWEPWLSSGSDADIQYVHKVLRHRVAVHENGGRSVNRRAYQIHKRDLELLEERHPYLRTLSYDSSPIPSAASLPEQKYRIEVNPDGSWRIVENLQPGEAGVTIVSRSNDTFQLSNGKTLDVRKVGGLWEVAEVDLSTGMGSVVARGTNKKQLIDDILGRYPRDGAPTPPPTPAREVLADLPPAPRTQERILEELEDVELSWSKVGRNHVAYYDDFEVVIKTAPKDSSSKYVIEVISPDGVKASDTSHVNLDNTKGLVKRFRLQPEIQKFELRVRERAIREAIGDTGEWPGLSLAEDSFKDYGNGLTELAEIEFGDGSSLLLSWNGNTWVSSRKIYGAHIGEQPVAFANDNWDEFSEALDELYPGIKKMLDEQLPGRPIESPDGTISFEDAPTPAPPVGAGPLSFPDLESANARMDKMSIKQLDELANRPVEQLPDVVTPRIVTISADDITFEESRIAPSLRTEEGWFVEFSHPVDTNDGRFTVDIEETVDGEIRLYFGHESIVSYRDDETVDSFDDAREAIAKKINEFYSDDYWYYQAFAAFDADTLTYLPSEVNGGYYATWNGYTLQVEPSGPKNSYYIAVTDPDGVLRSVSESTLTSRFSIDNPIGQRHLRDFYALDVANRAKLLASGEEAPTPPTPAPAPVQTPSGPDVPPWEQTFDQFVESGRTLYHGTPQEFDFFDSMDATYRGRGQQPSAARGRFYFTDDPEVAGDFRQNITGVNPESWLSRTDFDIEDLEDPEIFQMFFTDVQSNLNRVSGRLQIMDDAGDWVDLDIDDLTPEIVLSETPMRSVSDRGQVIQTRVFGRELDLTGDLSDAPEDLIEALRLDGLLDEQARAAKLAPGYQFRHERSFDNTAAWMRQNGYGRALVPDAKDSGGRSYIGLEEYIEYGRDPQQLHGQLQTGRTVVPPAPEPEPIVPGLKREYAGKYRYTKETGEQFSIEQVRPEGKGRVWRVTDSEGVEVGDFPRREDATAFLEGREPAAPRQTLPPEIRSLVDEFSNAARELEDVSVELSDHWAKVLDGDDIGGMDVAASWAKLDELYDYMANVLEILAFDHSDVARRLISRIPDIDGGGSRIPPDISAVLSDLIEDVVSRAPRPTRTPTVPPSGGAQQYFGTAPIGAGETFTPPPPRTDFFDRDEAAYWANRTANRVREPKARVVRDEVWESNRAAVIAHLQDNYDWLEAALSDGMLLQDMNGEEFEQWVERVVTFLEGVDPSIDPFDEVVDKTRYSRAAAEIGLERFRTAEMDPVIGAIIRDNDLFGPEIVAETIKRHFALSKDVKGAEAFFQNFWRPYYTASKSWMTQGRGYGYTGRNIIGSMYNSWLADVRARHFKQAASMLAARRSAREEADKILARRPVQEGETTVEAWERIFDTELRRFLREGVGGFAGMRDEVAERVADAYQSFTDRNYGGRTARSRTWGDILDRGEFDAPVYDVPGSNRRAADLFPGRTVDELNRAQKIANTSIDNPWMRHVTRVNESAEDYLRFAAFLRGVDTYGLEDGGFAAGTWVVGTQFDYANLSDFERRVMKNAIPFYTWTRYNVPLQIRSVWMEPGKVNRLLRFHEEVVKAWTGESKEDEQSLPEWLRRRGGWMTTMQTPFTDPETPLGRIFGFKEDPVAAFIESPLSDLGMLFNATLNPLQLMNTDEVVNNLNPILGRTVYELATGRSYVSGRELDSDAVAPRWAAPIAWARGRRNDDGELVFSQKWAQTFRNLLPPFAQAERLLAPLLGDERARRRWLTTLGSQLVAAPTYTVDPNQQAFAITTYAQGIQDALDDGIIGFDDKRDVARRLLDMGYPASDIARLGLAENDPSTLNFDELARARRNVTSEEQISRFLETLPDSVAEQFIFSRGFRGQTGVDAVEAWRNRQPIDELGALALPEINAAFADWFGRLSESDKLGLVFRYGYGPYRGAEAVQQWSTRGGLPNRPPGLGSADFLL